MAEGLRAHGSGLHVQRNGLHDIPEGEFLYRDDDPIHRNLKRTTQEHLAELLHLGEALDRATHSSKTDD